MNGGNTFEGKTVTLANDIVLNEGVLDENGELNDDGSNFKQWTPIGNDFSFQFKGSFDGNGHTVSGIYINNENVDDQGLFGYVDNKGEITNVRVEDSYIDVNYSAGGIVGQNYGTVSNCSNSGTVIGIGTTVGGIVGENGGTVSNCSNSGTMIGTGVHVYVGGIVGYNNNGTVSNCSNSGAVTGTAYYVYVGGIAGNGSGMVTNCSNSAEVSGTGNAAVFVGGIVGINGTVSDCFYLKGTCETGLGSGSEGVTEKTPEEYESGEVAFLLQGEQTEQLIWGQLIGVDEYPVLGGPEVVRNDDGSYTNKVYTLTTITQPTESGTITATANAGITEDKVAESATVTLEAIPAAGYEFVEWFVTKSDGDEGETVEVTDNAFTMPAGDVTVTATFKKKSYALTITQPEGGSITTASGEEIGEMVEFGATVKLVATAKDGYEFSGWSIEGVEIEETDAEIEFAMPARDVTVAATFTKIEPEPDPGTDDPEPEPEPEPTPEPSPAPEPEPTYYRVDLRPMTGATIIPSSRVVEEGGTLTFTIEIEEGYVADSMMVTVSQGIGKAVEVKPDEEGIYTIKNVDGLVTITVYGVKEATPVGMEDIEGVQVYAHEGAIYVYTPTEKRVMIVAMNGVLKANGEQIGKRRYELPRGFYVVWVEGESFKVAN